MRRVFVLFALLLGLPLAACALSAATPTKESSSAKTAVPKSDLFPTAPKGAVMQTTVVRVIDGDTIEIDGNLRVRYIGVDTPEVSGKVECYGREATQKNRELVEGKRVRLEKDVSETDRYGRLLRYVYVGDTFVNAELVREGYAQAATYPPDVKYQELFTRLQREAREAKRGLWGKCG